MSTHNSRGYIMVTNNRGDRMRVSVDDYNSGAINSENSPEYKYDLEWDLSHGFTEANKAFDEIENGRFDTFSQLSEEEQIAIMQTWDKDMWDKFRMQNTVTEEEVFGPLPNDDD